MVPITRLSETELAASVFGAFGYVYYRLRRSILLSAAAFGVFLLFLGGTVFQAIGEPATAGIIGASGMVIFFVNVFFYVVYKFMVKRY